MENAGNDDAQQKLYQLIWKRAIASQMASAKIEKTEISIDISTRDEQLIAKGEILDFDGFIKVWGGGKEDTILPKIDVDTKLDLEEMRAAQSYDRPPARYSEASLVKKLKSWVWPPKYLRPTSLLFRPAVTSRRPTPRGVIVRSDSYAERRRDHKR